MNDAATIHVVVAGGGTGGHVYPGIAVYQSLVETVGAVEVLFVGVRGGMEEKILAAHGLPYVLIEGRGLRGASLATRLWAPLRLAASVVAARRAIRAFGADVVVGTGGFASAASVIAALLARLPVVLQEQNSVPGLVNRRLARFANLVLLSYEASRRYIPSRVATAVVGNPLRRMERVSREDAAEYFGLEAGRETVLVIGGSRGAHQLNVAGAGAAEDIARRRGAQFILLTGDNDYERLRTLLGEVADRVKVLRYLEDVHMAYAIADVAVARAGASSVFELAAWGVASVFVPYPHAADDHQARNVAPLVEAGAAVVVPDADADKARLAREVEALLDDPGRRMAMSEAIRTWSRPDAARAAAALIADVVKKKAPMAGADRDSRTHTMTGARRASLRVVRR